MSCRCVGGYGFAAGRAWDLSDEITLVFQEAILPIGYCWPTAIMRMCTRYLEPMGAFLSDKIGRCNKRLGCISLKLQDKARTTTHCCRTSAVE